MIRYTILYQKNRRYGERYGRFIGVRHLLPSRKSSSNHATRAPLLLVIVDPWMTVCSLLSGDPCAKLYVRDDYAYHAKQEEPGKKSVAVTIEPSALRCNVGIMVAWVASVK